jgi:hypothetical protein
VPVADQGNGGGNALNKKEKEILSDLLEQIEDAWKARTNYLSKYGETCEGYARATGYGYATIREIQEELEIMLGISERYE